MSDNCEYSVSGSRHHHFRWFFEGNRDIAKIDVPSCGQDSDIYVTPTASHVDYRVTAPQDEFGTGTNYHGRIFYNLALFVDEAPEYYISSGILYFYGPTNALGSAWYTYNTIFGGTIASDSYTSVHCTEEEDWIVYKIAVLGVPDGSTPDRCETFEDAVVYEVREPDGRCFKGKIKLEPEQYCCHLYDRQIRNGVLRVLVPKR